MTQNKQDKNVANQGDTIKHAPIGDLADILRRYSERIAYFDPFCYLLHAPASITHAAWLRDIRLRMETWPAYMRLFGIQDTRLAAGVNYRCGVGLALDAIGPNMLKWALLAEKHQATRERLIDQLKAEALATKLLGKMVQERADDTDRAVAEYKAVVEASEGLLGLIDPFTAAKAPWENIARGLNRAVRPGAHGIIITFVYGAHEWPSRLTDALRQVRTIREGHFNLATYATAEVAEEAAIGLDRFGWTAPR